VVKAYNKSCNRSSQPAHEEHSLQALGLNNSPHPDAQDNMDALQTSGINKLTMMTSTWLPTASQATSRVIKSLGYQLPHVAQAE
jgi:hypothetical protein